jgi:hypothetical protein
MTVGWIFEGDRDRFLSAKDPVRVPPPTPRAYQCPFCDTAFPKREQLDVHLQTSHTMMRPFLLLSGAEPSTNDVIRTRIGARAINLFHCSELQFCIDGEPFRRADPDELSKALGKLSRATMILRLLDRADRRAKPVTQDYRLRIAIPDENALANVDRLFVTRLGDGRCDLRQIDAFYELTRDGVAAEYAEALADYVRAVLIKDGDKRTGVSTRVSHYRDIQSRALNTLRHFHRPLAVLLCALIRFGLNDFSDWNCASGFDRIDKANAILGPLVFGAIQEIKRTLISDIHKMRVFNCPVDIGVDTVTQEAERLTGLARWGGGTERRLSTLSDRLNLDALDRVKIRALWAMTAMRLAATTSAVTALRLLDGDPAFGRWAAACLTEIDS